MLSRYASITVHIGVHDTNGSDDEDVDDDDAVANFPPVSDADDTQLGSIDAPPLLSSLLVFEWGQNGEWVKPSRAAHSFD